MSPRTVNAGDTITITGSNFSAVAAENTVTLSGFRRRSRLRQRRSCAPSFRAAYHPGPWCFERPLGAVASNSENITVNGAAISAVQLARGQALLLTNIADMQCQRLSSQSGLSYLIIPQNVSDVVASQTPFELASLATGVIAGMAELGLPSATDDYASRWELRLRERERAFASGGAAAPGEHRLEYQVAPDVGDRRQFKVFDKNDRFVTVNAEVKAISTHAIIYQDLDAPANGFTTADFQKLGSSFSTTRSTTRMSRPTAHPATSTATARSSSCSHRW